jgi:hypothetical protein
VTVRFVDAGALPPGVVFRRGDNLPDGGRVLRRLVVALLVGAASVHLGPAATVLIPVLVLTVWAAMGWVDRWRRGTAGAVAKVVLPPKW